MDKARDKNRLRGRRPAPRKLVQCYSALLYNAHLRGFIEGKIYRGGTKAVCAPGLHCYSCPGAIGSCPLGAIQNALASSGHRAGWYILGILLLYGVMLGRTVCGWLCPLGLLQELLHLIPGPKIRKSRFTRSLSWLKYVILAVFVLSVPLWYGLAYHIALPAFCKYLCPAGTLEGAMALLPANPSFLSMLGVIFTRKFVIMLATGLACVFCYRSFCRFLCPLGALYSLFSRFNVIGVKVDEDRCNRCGACVQCCEMDVRHVGDHECIHCGKCMDFCKQRAISVKAGRITLKAPDTLSPADRAGMRSGSGTVRRLLCGIALAFLCFALLWYNVLDPAVQADALSLPGSVRESSAPVGFEPGQQLEDFTVECLDGSVFHLAETRGKVTFLNLWATWCAPCIQELPFFCDLYLQHPEDLAVLALHSSFVTEDPGSWLAGRDFVIPFAVDAEDERLFKIMNGGATLPRTIVLNRRGEVVYNEVGSVTPEKLAALYEEAKK